VHQRRGRNTHPFVPPLRRPALRRQLQVCIAAVVVMYIRRKKTNDCRVLEAVECQLFSTPIILVERRLMLISLAHETQECAGQGVMNNGDIHQGNIEDQEEGGHEDADSLQEGGSDIEGVEMVISFL